MKYLLKFISFEAQFLPSLIFLCLFQEQDIIKGASDVQVPAVHPEDDVGYSAWLAGESQAVEYYDFSSIDDSLLCKEIFDSSSLFLSNSGNVSYNGSAHTRNEVTEDTTNNNNNNNAPCGIADLENLELDTPPDFQLAVNLISHPNSSASLLYLN